MKPPRQFFAPLAAGAPQPFRDLPVKLERMIHFIPAHNPKMRAKAKDMLAECDVLLANLEDAIPADEKVNARHGLIEMARTVDFAGAGVGYWTRINCLNSPWHLEEVSEIVAEAGDKIDVMIIPKVEGAWDIFYMDQLLATLEARHKVKRPILLHALLETAQGVVNVESICGASPRMQGISLGPADLAASRAMKTTRVGGGHPGYRVIEDPREDGGARASAQQDLWHYTFARMVDACVTHGIKPFYGPFGAFDDPEACEQQFRNAYLMGCAGAWTLHPSQIAIAKRVFSPDVDEVLFAKKILAAMPDGSGVAMVDGKMQDDATWKQAKVIVDLARQVAAKDKDMATVYGF
ncbi:MAG: CoA ester lyase [Alphaproteobacteria bacterium]|nr:CoA ester lyase [Alphaproteobacteria bacterium]MDZ4777402.1 CoA ester lyase [Alphaproteobacteria bacterium]